MANLDGYYRLSSYISLNQDDSITRAPRKGTMCSGAIYFAHKLCGKEMNLAKFSEDKVKQAAQNVYNYLWEMAKKGSCGRLSLIPRQTG